MILAQIPDTVISGVVQASVYGPIVLWFMWRDSKAGDRYVEREQRTDAQMGQMTEAINHLIRVTGIEVMSRPGVAQRMKDETQELLHAADNRRGK